MGIANTQIFLTEIFLSLTPREKFDTRDVNNKIVKIFDLQKRELRRMFSETVGGIRKRK